MRELGPHDQIKVVHGGQGHYWVHFFNFLTESGWMVKLFNPVLSCPLPKVMRSPQFTPAAMAKAKQKSAA